MVEGIENWLNRPRSVRWPRCASQPMLPRRRAFCCSRKLLGGSRQSIQSPRSFMATFDRDTQHYETWLHKQCDVVECALEAKHERMRKSAFDFCDYLLPTGQRGPTRSVPDSPRLRACCASETCMQKISAPGAMPTGARAWGLNDRRV